jgi:hypothetical protein
MTTSVELLVLGLAIVAAWLSVRPAPPLDWERLWKTILATIIRGDVEATGGDAELWWERLVVVPYHPAGRHPVEKLCSPSVEAIIVPAMEGERALVERLVGKSTIQERWEEMYRSDLAAEEALMLNPSELGPAYDPTISIAPTIGWEQVARWSADTQSAIARRLKDVVVVVVGHEVEGLLSTVPHARAVQVPVGLNPGAMEEALLGVCPQSHERLMVIAAGDSVFPLIQALHASPGLRDRVLTVISLAADLQSPDRQAWMTDHFQHLDFDTEVNRRTLYMSVSSMVLEPIEVMDQAFPDPPVPPSGWAPIESVDLGLLPLDRQNPELLARALWVLLCFCLSSR